MGVVAFDQDLFLRSLKISGELLDRADDPLKYFVRYLRLPRVVSALAVGGILAANGVILQNVLNNPLASSFTLGLSQGAAFGASFALISLTGGLAGVAISILLGAATMSLQYFATDTQAVATLF